MSSADRACALCLQAKKLCRSHIIPNFLYSDVYDDTGKRIVVRSATDYPEKFRQSGYWEWLLCESCEVLISGWESYAAKILKGEIELIGNRAGQVMDLQGIDYNKFKLFQLSVLWKASVATSVFFERVNLGPHQETIRKMLLCGTPGRDYEYPCMLTALVLDGAPATMIIQPTEGRLFNNRIYRFVFGGVLWAFVVTGHAVRTIPGCLAETGRVEFLIKDAMQFEYFTKLMNRVIAKETPKDEQ